LLFVTLNGSDDSGIRHATFEDAPNFEDFDTCATGIFEDSGHLRT
jgi:hypothetical protein